MLTQKRHNRSKIQVAQNRSVCQEMKVNNQKKKTKVIFSNLSIVRNKTTKLNETSRLPFKLQVELMCSYLLLPVNTDIL